MRLPEPPPRPRAQTLSGVVIRQLSASPHGGYDLDIRLDRPSHQDAIADIESALRQFGFDTAQAVITEWVTSVVEGALLGGAGGTAIGSASKDPVAIVVGAVIGLLVGAAVGSAMQTVKATYEANRLHPFGGGWHLTVVPPPDMHLGRKRAGHPPKRVALRVNLPTDLFQARRTSSSYSCG